MTTTVSHSSTSPRSSRHGSPLVLWLLGIAWFATPFLVMAAAVEGATFFGEPPSAGREMAARMLLAAAFATGLAAPGIGAWLATKWRRRAAAWALGVQCAITALATAYLLGAMPDVLLQ